MNKGSKIYIAGHRGLAGSALVRRLRAKGYQNLVVRPHSDLDLIEQNPVREFFRAERPDVVFLAAAKVGGILANNTYPADFIYRNLAIQTNVIQAAHESGVRELMFLGSTCIYPRECPQPMNEAHLLAGPLEPTNRPYAVAKIAGIEMCWSFNRQYGTKYLCAMPTNLYGPGDNYDLQNGHVLAALIRKFHRAKVLRENSVTLWGSGAPRREFLYSDDMADACIYVMELPREETTRALGDQHPPLFNIGLGSDLSIQEVAELVRQTVGVKCQIVYDRSKPDGMPRKLLDIGLITSLGWRPRVSLAEGLRNAYQDFVSSDVAAVDEDA